MAFTADSEAVGLPAKPRVAVGWSSRSASSGALDIVDAVRDVVVVNS